MSKERNSTLEGLRIISMIMVLGLHYLNKSIGGGLNAENTWNTLYTHAMESVCITSVNVFVLISGYFMINIQTIELKKAVNLYLVMPFYYILFFFIGIVTGVYKYSLKEMAYAVFPFFTGNGWFLKSYIILLLIAPYINRLINCLNRHSLGMLIIIQCVFFVFWPSFLPKPPVGDGGYGIVNFLTLYLIAAYIRKYCVFKEIKKTKKIAVLAYMVSCILITLLSFSPLKKQAWNYDFVFNISGSIALFVFFLNLPARSNKTINLIATTTFGVYIAHANPYTRQFIYRDLMHTDSFVNSPWQILHFFGCIILQFLAFSLLDLCRQVIWKKTVTKYLDKSRWLKKEQGYEPKIT